MSFNGSKKTEEEIEKEIEYYKFVLSQYPYDYITLTMYGQALCSLGRFQEGIEKFVTVHLFNQTDFNSLNNIALAYLGQHKYAESLKFFDKAILLNKDSALLYENKGIAYTHLGDWKRAIICYDVALSIDPNCQRTILNREDALFNHANALELHGNLEESVECFEKLLLKYGSAQKFYINKAETFKQTERFADAIACYDKCISFGKNTAEYIKAHLEKVSILIEFKRYREAITTCDKLINLKNISKKELMNAHEEKGNSYFLLKKYAQAAESFKKEIELNSVDLMTDNYEKILKTIKK